MIAYRQAIALTPNFASAHNNLANALKARGQIDAAVEEYWHAVEFRPDLPQFGDNLLYAMHFQPGIDAAALLDAHLGWDEQYAQRLKLEIKPHDNDRKVDRRLRIGYVSPNFYEHVVGRNLFPLLREHDRERFEVFCYANSRDEDALTARFQSFADGWRNITGLEDDAAADQIRADRIDILLDLSLHMEGNRLLVFARKPAPVQVTFAGYPSGTGLQTMDYRLTDPYLDPPGQTDGHYRERSIRLPRSFWCFDPIDDQADVGPPPFRSRGGQITFGCLSNFCKVNDHVLDLWSQVLTRVKNSRLLLQAPQGSHRQETLDRLAQAGIDPERVEFEAYRPRREYLELYRRIDIGLDTFPYNGHSTSLDSFWMGVPVITLVGETAVARRDGVSCRTWD